jgi:hypothetical protein
VIVGKCKQFSNIFVENSSNRVGWAMGRFVFRECFTTILITSIGRKCILLTTPQSMLVPALQLLVGLIGAILLYTALFLHETEEGRVQNRLEKLWVDIDDLSKAALSKQTAFLQQISAMANSGLSKLFGARLFSAGAVSASLCLSLGSALLLTRAAQVYLFPHSFRFTFSTFAIGTVSLLVGLFPVPFRYVGFLWIPFALFLMIYMDWNLPYQSQGWKFVVRESQPLLAMLVGGFISDVFFIALSRWCLRKGSELNDGWKIVVLLTLNGCIGLSLVSPLIVATLMEMAHPYGGVTFAFPNPLIVWGASNGVTGAIALLFVVLAVVAIAHLAVWPLLERPLYSLQRFGVARNPKLLAATSVTCLLFAWPHSPIIQAITKLIHG